MSVHIGGLRINSIMVANCSFDFHVVQHVYSSQQHIMLFFAVAVCRLLFIRVGVVDLYALPSTPHMHVASLHVVHQRS